MERNKELPSSSRKRLTDLARDLADAERVGTERVGMTMQVVKKSASLCEWIVERFRDEFPPELIAEIGLRGKWKREVADGYEQERSNSELRQKT